MQVLSRYYVTWDHPSQRSYIQLLSVKSAGTLDDYPISCYSCQPSVLPPVRGPQLRWVAARDTFACTPQLRLEFRGHWNSRIINILLRKWKSIEHGCFLIAKKTLFVTSRRGIQNASKMMSNLASPDICRWSRAEAIFAVNGCWPPRNRRNSNSFRPRQLWQMGWI